jgi:NAD(P)H-nitrite reductase large subunit
LYHLIIYIGGNGGTEVTVGQLLTTVETEDQVVQLCGALMQYYRETGIYAEPFSTEMTPKSLTPDSTQLLGQPETPILNL